MDGVIIVDKPREWTSHDVVNKMRRLAGTRKIGHLGTLDPGATGVLPLVIGRATRLAQFFTRNDKTYQGVIHFGYSTDSYDMDGAATSPEARVTLDRQALDTPTRPLSWGDPADPSSGFGERRSRGGRRMNWRAKASRWNWNR